MTFIAATILTMKCFLRTVDETHAVRERNLISIHIHIFICFSVSSVNFHEGFLPWLRRRRRGRRRLLLDVRFSLDATLLSVARLTLTLFERMRQHSQRRYHNDAVFVKTVAAQMSLYLSRSSSPSLLSPLVGGPSTNTHISHCNALFE